jgi:hypothetical protein
VTKLKGNAMKKIAIISLIILTGLFPALAYTPEQQTTLDGMRLSFQLGLAYQQARSGQNVDAYNNLVDQYNTWVRQHFGNDGNLLMPKMNSTTATPLYPNVPPQYTSSIAQRNPFNDSSDLSQFGRKSVMAQLSSDTLQNRNIAEANIADWVLNTF